MGDHRAAGVRGGVDLPEPRGNVLVRQAVEAVAADSLLNDSLRQGVKLIERRAIAMERSVEGRHLRHMGQCHRDGANHRDVLRLV